MRRTATIVGLALLVLLVPAAALATAPSEVEVDTYYCSIDCQSQDIGPIEGIITCTNGEQFFIRANVRQLGETVAVGRASGVCTGSEQIWTTNRTDNPGTLAVCDAHSLGGKGTAGGTPFHIPTVNIPDQC